MVLHQYKHEARESVRMRREKHTRLRFGLVLLILIQSLICSMAALGDEDDLRLAAGLRERRLFDHAEFVCRQALEELVDSKSDGREQVAFVVERIRIRSEQARFAPPEQRETFRLAARAVGEQFLSDNPQHPRRVIVQLQTVLIDSDLVNLVGQEQDFGVGSEADRQQALELSQNVRTGLRSMDRELADQLQKARNDSAADSASLSAAELTSLQRNVQFHIAAGGLQRAKLYGKSGEQASLNQASALSEVLQQLNSLQRANEPGSGLWWRTQLALVKCHRQLDDLATARTVLDRTHEIDLKRSRRAWQEAILAEEAELLLAGGMKTEAQLRGTERLLLAIDGRSVASARLDWLALNLVVGMNVVAASDSKRQEHLSQANRRADLIARQHGPWWGHRAKQLVLKSFKGPGQGGEVSSRYSQWVQQGQTAMAASQFAQASEAYDQAAAIAEGSSDLSAWRSCRISSSQALEQLGKHAMAAEKLIESANREPEHSAAASIHLRAIWNLGRDLEGSKDSKSIFTKALQQHLEQWPDSETANQARVWLGKEQLASGRFTAASDTLQQVSKDSKHRGVAIGLAADALTKSNDSSAETSINSLVKERPQELTLLLAQARISTRVGLEQNPVASKRPLELWRGLARRLKPETDQWFEAKYNVARLLVAANEQAKAAQLINYLAALPAGWSKCSFANQLTELQRTVDRLVPAN